VENKNSLYNQHFTIVSLIGFGACAVGYFLFFQWFAYQECLDFRRLLPALLSVVCFMYAIYRTVPILEDFWGLKRTSIDTSHPACVYIGIGLWVFFVNTLIYSFGHQLEHGASFTVVLENFFGRYTNDTPHYIAIAQRWYQNTLDDHGRLIVFFPFYPILLRIMFVVTPTYMFAAWFVSNVFAFGSGVMLYKLGRLITDEREARLAVKFIYIFPSALFFFVPMTESLFLFLSVAVIYYALRERFGLVFVFGLMATLTRSAGALLIIPVACEIIGQMRKEAEEMRESKPGEDTASEQHVELWQRITRGKYRNVVKFMSLSSFILGMAIYLLINRIVYGNATQFMFYQYDYWHQALYFFWHTITYLIYTVFNSEIDWVIGAAVPGVIAFCMTLILITYGAKKVRVSLTLFALGYFIFAFGPTWLMSGPRYAAVLFPLAFVGAKIAAKKKGYNLVLTIAYLAMFALYFHEFVRDNYVF